VPTTLNSGFLQDFSFADPKTGLKTVHHAMWDLRETSLNTQAFDATRGHAQGIGPIPQKFPDDIASFERANMNLPASLATRHIVAPTLDPKHANPADTFFGTPKFPSDPVALKNAYFATVDIRPGTPEWRGMQVFAGTQQHPHCIVCHNMPDVLNGATVPARTDLVSEFNRSNFPIIHMRLKNVDASGRFIGFHDVDTPDPGVAGTTGLLKDLNTFKVPQLRGISKFGNFFHDGGDDSIDLVILHYIFLLPNIFGDITPFGPAHQDLKAFLNAL
jgi:hypothetical protein